ncbi:MAG TPA: hypothetical protein VHC22_27900 [Pirellulales bacterium]|nr:hypothetical protein [Pirellulales bacterium]
MSDLIIVVVFIVSIVLPLAVMVVRPNVTAVANENRLASPWPPLPADQGSWEQFPTEATNWFDDHLGLRNWAIQSYNLITVLWLRSPTQLAPRVIPGADGWLFLNHEKCLDGCRVAFSGEELEEWGRALRSYQKVVRENSAKLLVVVVPDKQSIYQEKLPEEIPWTNERSRLQTFINRFHEEVDILDLRELLLTAKAQHDVYFRYDTHWNELGGFVSYQALVRRLGLEPLLWESVEITEQPRNGGDLSKMLELTQSEEAPKINPRLGFQARKVEAKPGRASADTYYENSSRDSCRVLIFHDSFFDGFVNPWLAEHFSRTRCVLTYQGPSREQIVDEHPDIVIFELAERYLMHPAPLPFDEPSGEPSSHGEWH